VPEVPPEVKRQLVKLSERLDKRASKHAVIDRYYEGSSPLPPAIIRAGVTKAYRMLMPVAEAPWGSLVVGSTQDRLEVSGIRTGDQDLDDKAWGLWQDNEMDAESDIAHDAALVDGRAFAMVWPEDGVPAISLDNTATMIVQYREGSRRHRMAALRRWVDDDQYPFATLYRPDGIFKFQGPRYSSGRAGTQWQVRQPPADAEWPMPNASGVVPVVELAINRRLKPGTLAYARGDYEHCTGLIDRINLLTFLGLVVAFYLGFPLRGTIGEKVLRDDNGDPIAPFDSNAPGIFQLENPQAQIVEYKAADRKNLSIFAELDQLATITSTPRHYFPMDGGMSNLSADTIRASEGALHAKVTGYKKTLGQGWLGVTQLCGLMSKEKLEIPARAEIRWKDHESRSLAERADAAVKLKDILPWQVIAERCLNATQDEIARWQAERSSDVLGQLVAEAAQAPPVPATVGNGGQPAG
jgi:Phage portal protein, SPP1 Gp6-like